MERIESLELTEYRSDIIIDVKNLIEKYRTIFEWDVPDADEKLVNALILTEVRQVLDDIQNELMP